MLWDSKGGICERSYLNMCKMNFDWEFNGRVQIDWEFDWARYLCLALLQQINTLLHHSLTGSIQRTCRLVQQQHGGTFYQGSRDGNALFLTPTDHDRAFAHVGVVAVREC